MNQATSRAMAIPDAWDKLLATRWMLDGEIGYPGPDGRVFRSSAYKQAFASLVLVDLLALLDEALLETLTARGVACGTTLHDRIKAAEGLIWNGDELQALRKTRNELAHVRARVLDFADVDLALPQVHQALTALGYTVRFPHPLLLETDWGTWETVEGRADVWDREHVMRLKTSHAPFECLAIHTCKERVFGADPNAAGMGRLTPGRWDWA